MQNMRASIERYCDENVPKHPTQRADASQDLYAARQLEYVYSKTYDVVYPELPMGEGQIIGFDTTVPRGASTFVYWTIDQNGMAVILDSYDSASVPEVSLSGKETVGVIRDQGLKYSFNVKDMEAAAFSNTPLQTTKANACKRGQVQLRDKIGWFGDPARGLYGLLTIPNTTQTLAPFSIAVGTSRLWSDKTAQEILNDVGTLVNTPYLLSIGAEMVNTVYLPATVAAQIRIRYVNTANGSNVSIYKSLVENFPQVTFKEAFQLDAAQHAAVSQFAGMNVAVAFNSSTEKISLVVPIVFDQLAPEKEGFNTNVFTRASVGGIKCPYPLSVSVLLGL